MVDIPDSTFLKANFNEKIENNENDFLDAASQQMDQLAYSERESAPISAEEFFDASDEPILNTIDLVDSNGKFYQFSFKLKYFLNNCFIHFSEFIN